MNYLKESAVTASGAYHAEMVDDGMLRDALNDAIESLKTLDVIKKALFYGRPIPPNYEQADVAQYGAVQVHMLHNESQKGIDLLHGILGLATESGEMLEALAKSLSTGQPIDLVNLAEENGDVDWYQAMMARVMGTTFEMWQKTNIAKLRKRFPNGFAEYDAQQENRDLAGERAILEGPVPVERLFEEEEAEAVARTRAMEAGLQFSKMDKWEIVSMGGQYPRAFLSGFTKGHPRLGDSRYPVDTSSIVDFIGVDLRAFKKGDVVVTRNTVYLLLDPK